MGHQSDGADPQSVSLRHQLRADCSRCFGLCCVAPAFAASSEFALDKPAGRPCPHLQRHSCTIHAQLKDRGFTGCTVYDCFGAGQQVAQVTFGGRSWHDDPANATLMFDVFLVVRQLHELLWYLSEASGWPAAEPLRADLEARRAEIARWTNEPPEQLVGLDLAGLRLNVLDLLARASDLVRGRTPRRGNRGGADLVGRDFRYRDLRRANLRGTLLLGADLRDCDLRLADLLGADLRGADLRRADLSSALFLTQVQVAAAGGDQTTKLPSGLRRPLHWLSG